MTSINPSRDFPKSYIPSSVEERIYKFWLDGDYFKPVSRNDKTPFVLIMPPPNVTGELHLGHALTAAIQDTLTRWHRMHGDPSLWLPGTDHAGIATQVMVEKELAKEGKTRYDLGRELFIERVWEWVRKYDGIIRSQHQRLGASCDWSKEQFTLNDGPSMAVRTTFVNLYNKGSIYRGKRIINWCPRCATALSDLEVVHSEVQGNLYYIRYHHESDNGYVTVATTRPETLFGDTAVAVNPKDKRYKKLTQGKHLILPIIGRLLPVIADDSVDITFGTGALKITPGHDPTDFEVGKKHGLETRNVMNLDGTLNEQAGPYEGSERYVAREALITELTEKNLLEKIEPYTMSIGHCSRCNSIAEPLVSEQWFVKMSPSEPPAKPALDAINNGNIQIVPSRFRRVYLNWMENIRDWCISRQLWWGHRIPVWYCEECESQTVEIKDPTRCGKCNSIKINQDPDVLDTWFSSALWPHSTLGWPSKTDDIKRFYPGTVMETGYDILFFWVARMIMMGLENTGQVPFHTVYLHGLIRDVEGIKMSKSRGNVIDPLKTVDMYGADALRFAITTGTTPGNDSRIGEAKLEASRNFANKLWNASRFVISSLNGVETIGEWSDLKLTGNREDRWILSKYNKVVQRVDQFLTEFQIGEAEKALYDFIWNEFCDWYIEMAKVRLRNADTSVYPVLIHVLEGTLRLLHPFMPFITEELWQRLRETLSQQSSLPPSIMIAPYPKTNKSTIDTKSESEIEFVSDIIRAIRNIRAEFSIDPSRVLYITISSPSMQTIVKEETNVVETMAKVQIREAHTLSPSSNIVLVVKNATVSLDIGALVDIDTERKRLLKEMGESQQHINRLSQNLADKEFISKAPSEVVERENERLSSLKERNGIVKELLAQLNET